MNEDHFRTNGNGVVYVICSFCGTEKRWLNPGFDPKRAHELPEGWEAVREYDKTKYICCDRDICREWCDNVDKDGHDLKLLMDTELERYPLIIGLIKTEWGKDELEASIRRRKKSLPTGTIQVDREETQAQEDNRMHDHESG